MSIETDTTDSWLELIPPKNLYAFYLLFMVPMDDVKYPQYKLFPNIPRTDAVQKAEVIAIVETGTRLAELEQMILTFAEKEVGLSPAGLYFPHYRLEYMKIGNCLFNIAHCWESQILLYNESLALEAQISASPELTLEYSDRGAMLSQIYQILAKKMADTATTIISLEGA
jgi:hypothetical protein